MFGLATGENITPERAQADPDGHIRVISGWQGDIPPHDELQTACVPVARKPNGDKLTGSVLVRLGDMPQACVTLPLVQGLGRPIPCPAPASLDTSSARLLRFEADDRPPVQVASEDWCFGNCDSVPFPGVPDPTKISLREGFDPHFAYVLVYEAVDPKILGIGFAATRDFVTFLRHATSDTSGQPNPLVGAVRWTVASGVSQAGNFLRSFVHLGFNQGEDGRRVFDGMNIHIAARQLPLNVRFGSPSGAANLYELGSEGTLWWGSYDDSVRGRGISSLLTRSRATGTIPKIIETFGSSEFWGLRMSPNLVGTDALADIPLPSNVRRYYFPGVTHYGALTTSFSLQEGQWFPGMPKAVMSGNPNPLGPTMRAVNRMLIAWVMKEREPPPSSYPTIAAGELVEPTATAMGWPRIPNTPVPDGKLNPFLDYALGHDFDYIDLSGIVSMQPPIIRSVLPSLVPRVNEDGNEMTGIPTLHHIVCLGTYTGWNERISGYGIGRGTGFYGGFVPFPISRDERLATNDPRLSLEERYGDHAGFVAKVREVALKLQAEDWLLPEDTRTLIKQAEESNILL